MQKIAKLARISWKISYRMLREKSPIFCNCLKLDVKISQIYLKHIDPNRWKRSIKEIIKRLLMINSVNNILSNWEYIEKREDNNYFYHRIELKIQWEIFCLILSEKKSKPWFLSLFSSFIK